MPGRISPPLSRGFRLHERPLRGTTAFGSAAARTAYCRCKRAFLRLTSVEFQGERTRPHMTAAKAIQPTDSRFHRANGRRTRVAVASDVRLYREGLAVLLGRIGDFDVVASAAGPDEAAARVREGEIDVIVLDFGEANVAAARQLLSSTPDARVVVLGELERPDDVIALAEAGVLGFAKREAHSLVRLAQTIESVAREELVCDPQVATLLVRRVQALAANRPRPIDRLSAREVGVLHLLAEGLSNREIAAHLHIELTTVKNHVHNILEKLGARTRAEAVALVRPRRVIVSGRES
jgi:two-component system nitrate/nitrite response regulator NarL